MVAHEDVLLKFLRYSQITKILRRDELGSGGRFSVDGFGYAVLNRIDDKPTSTTVWLVKKLGTNKLVVVFKPTKEPMDLIMDALAIPVKFKYTDLPKIHVHMGFNIAYGKIRDRLIRLMCEHSNHGDRITMVGHSLGGGLATLAMIDCLDQFPDSAISGYTMGSPRVLLGRSVKVLDGLFDYISRATNSKDTITRLPFEIMGYRHIGDEYDLHPSTPLTGAFKYHKIDAYIDMTHKALLR